LLPGAEEGVEHPRGASWQRSTCPRRHEGLRCLLLPPPRRLRKDTITTTPAKGQRNRRTKPAKPPCSSAHPPSLLSLSDSISLLSYSF
jgi:hypothetical protein